MRRFLTCRVLTEVATRVRVHHGLKGFKEGGVLDGHDEQRVRNGLMRRKSPRSLAGEVMSIRGAIVRAPSDAVRPLQPPPSRAAVFHQWPLQPTQLLGGSRSGPEPQRSRQWLWPPRGLRPGCRRRRGAPCRHLRFRVESSTAASQPAHALRPTPRHAQPVRRASPSSRSRPLRQGVKRLQQHRAEDALHGLRIGANPKRGFIQRKLDAGVTHVGRRGAGLHRAAGTSSRRSSFSSAPSRQKRGSRRRSRRQGPVAGHAAHTRRHRGPSTRVWISDASSVIACVLGAASGSRTRWPTSVKGRDDPGQAMLVDQGRCAVLGRSRSPGFFVQARQQLRDGATTNHLPLDAEQDLQPQDSPTARGRRHQRRRRRRVRDRPPRACGAAPRTAAPRRSHAPVTHRKACAPDHSGAAKSCAPPPPPTRPAPVTPATTSPASACQPAWPRHLHVAL